MTLPLLVRGGTVLPMGSCDYVADYSYSKDVELHVFGMAEGESFSFVIPTPAGNPGAYYTVRMGNGKAVVDTDTSDPFTVCLHL